MIPVQEPFFAEDSKDAFEIAMTVPADSEQTTKINVNISPGPDSTQPRNFKGTQAWNQWITNTTVCNLSIKNILVAEDRMVPKVTDF